MRIKAAITSLSCLFAFWWGMCSPPSLAAEVGRCNLWIDMCEGEPVADEVLLDDLATARMVYLGERHTIQRHHDVQAQILAGLARRGKSLVLGLEQLDSFQQPAVDRYSLGEIDFRQLAEATDWPHRWPNYEQYRSILESARRLKIPILALNARSEAIRQVVRSGGLDRMDRQAREQLPSDIDLDDPPYRQLLNLQMMVHASANPETLRPMVEAQIARDEAMAEALASYLNSEAGRGRSAVVLCGAGHVAYGLGTPTRVRRRIPGVNDRVVLLTESGDLVLSPQEKAAARAITITHEQLRQLARPVADYLYVTSLKAENGP